MIDMNFSDMIAINKYKIVDECATHASNYHLIAEEYANKKVELDSLQDNFATCLDCPYQDRLWVRQELKNCLDLLKFLQAINGFVARQIRFRQGLQHRLGQTKNLSNSRKCGAFCHLVILHIPIRGRIKFLELCHLV